MKKLRLKYILFFVFAGVCIVLMSIFIPLHDACDSRERELQISKFGYYDSSLVVDLDNNKKESTYALICTLPSIVTAIYGVMVIGDMVCESKKDK